MVWVLDQARSEVLFAVRQLLVSTVDGHFTEFQADLTLDAEHPERSSARAAIDVGSVSTGNALRDAHLRSSSFFDAAHYPQITFSSTYVRQVGADSFWLAGDLTIHGVTHEVTLRGRFAEPIAELIGRPEVRFSLEAEVDREDYGLTWNVPLDGGGVFVGKLVTIAIDATLVQTSPSALDSPGA